MITTWYLQSHRTWDRSRHSCIGSPSSPLGPSRRASLCRLTIRGTPDRSKLFGSHGQRPWLHDVVTPSRPDDRNSLESCHQLGSTVASDHPDEAVQRVGGHSSGKSRPIICGAVFPELTGRRSYGV